MAQGRADAGQHTLPGLLDERLTADPDGAFLDCCGTMYTAAAIEDAANRVAAALAALGVGHGSAVATICENSPAAVLSWFAAARLGAVYVPVNTALKGSRGENISSWEVEKVFHEHPDVTDVCVHAVVSELSEDDVKATLVLREGAALTAEQLCRWAIDRLPFYAVPRYIEFRAALPLSETGRATKNILKDEGVTAGTWDREAAGLRFERR